MRARCFIAGEGPYCESLPGRAQRVSTSGAERAFRRVCLAWSQRGSWVSQISTEGGGASTFTVGMRHGVWQVTRDGVFYGDYPVRQSAVDAAQRAAQLPPTRTRPAEIIFHDDDS